MKNKLLVQKTMLLCVVITCLFVACRGKNEPVEDPLPGTSVEEPVTDPVEEAPKPSTEEPTEVPVPSEEQPEMNPNGQKNPWKPIVTTPTSNREKNLEVYWTRLDEIASAAQDFYTEYFTKIRLVSKNGRLYDKSSEELVDAAYLCDNEGLNKQYRGLDVEILLIYGSDLANYSTLTIKDSDTGLTVFVAQRHPTEDKYLIASANSAGGLLTGSQYQSLLAKYNQNHGPINELFPGRPEYDRIVGFVKMYESNYSSYYVRCIYTDQKYAVVVLSSSASTAEVKEYILQKNGNLWEVVMDGIENESRVPVAVNKKLPDFNLDMLPKYTINDYKKSMKTTFIDVMPALVNNGFIDSAADISYIAGTNEYCYLYTAEHKRILCTYKNGGWFPVYMESAVKARETILSADKFGPAFIVLDQ